MDIPPRRAHARFQINRGREEREAGGPESRKAEAAKASEREAARVSRTRWNAGIATLAGEASWMETISAAFRSVSWMQQVRSMEPEKMLGPEASAADMPSSETGFGQQECSVVAAGTATEETEAWDAEPDAGFDPEWNHAPILQQPEAWAWMKTARISTLKSGKQGRLR